MSSQSYGTSFAILDHSVALQPLTTAYAIGTV